MSADLVWIACTECAAQVRAKCQTCEGTGQYQAPRPPRWDHLRATPHDLQRGLGWLQMLKEGIR